MDPGPEKSLGSGIAIPNWMKQKIGDRYDLDDTAFSPPSQDDNFFFIRYPKTTSRPQSETNYHRINQYIEKNQSDRSTAAVAGPSTQMATNAGTGISQALTGKTPSVTSSAFAPLPLEFDPDEAPPNLTHRRGSKSLPASPLSSPKTSPKFSRKSTLQNRYFTAAFPQPKQDGGYSGWLLAGLLGSRDPSTLLQEPLEPISESPGKPTLEIPGKSNNHDQVIRKSASAANLRNKDDEEDEVDKKVQPIFKEQVSKVKVIKPKPSELREMNFWSPTSM